MSRTEKNCGHSQRTSFKDLQKLPFNNNCACWFADTSGVVVITYLPVDDDQVC